MADKTFTYEFEVDGRVHHTHDGILDGRQIRLAADRSPPSGFILIEAKGHATRSVGLEETIHLEPDERSIFRTFEGDRTYSFTVDERGWEWGAATVAEADVRRYGGIDNDHDLILDADRDAVIEQGEAINLSGKEVEQIRTRRKVSQVTIIVNGRERVVQPGRITFEALIALAFEIPPVGQAVSFTVTFRKGDDSHSDGSLTAGQSVQVKNGMVFNVRATDKS
ncbi:multiubiquitin domain-containing protein [Methylobacterium planeticum]|uniref:Multi-ubiquitin domain-containing protein n=1 Tax=Methylobacterium planeticum TaxID=2615211 RepID=A0A6N6ML45_9HYPH|nr:multiubiquitin domain-containing protein [Methylobacterium planeticum]KAB1070739.1 hypothetical protein F6X51_21430 [Methylobacterium planeticum]